MYIMPVKFWMIANFIGALIFNYIYWYLFYLVATSESGICIGLILLILPGIFFVSVLVQTTNKFIQIIVRGLSKKIVMRKNKKSKIMFRIKELECFF